MEALVTIVIGTALMLAAAGAAHVRAYQIPGLGCQGTTLQRRGDALLFRMVARIQVVRFRPVRMRTGTLQLLDDQHAQRSAHGGIRGPLRAFEHGTGKINQSH